MNMSGLTTSLLSVLTFCLVVPCSVHLHAQTDTLWTKIIDINYQNSEAYAVNETEDGGYILTGRARALSSPATDLWLARTDSIGNIIWSNLFDLGLEDGEYGTDVRQTSDSGFIVVGATKGQG